MSIKAKVPLSLRRVVKILRVVTFETFGSTRYSWPALNKLDTQIEALFDSPGVFLEIGANDGYSQSNTWFLEKHRGWHGILIEALPGPFKYCRLLRRKSACFNVACVATGTLTDSDMVTVADSNLTSLILGQQDQAEETRRTASAARTLSVRATTLSAVIDDSPFDKVDFMSIDVEGAELAVLGGLDFARHTPRYLLVETDHPDRVDAVVATTMERVAQSSFHDFLWQAKL